MDSEAQLFQRNQEMEERIARLLKWFVANGGSIHPSVLFGPDKTGGISAFATKDIPDPPPGGIQICACPPELQISYHLVPKELHSLLPEHVLVNLALIQEFNLGDESRWAPYIECLPKSDQLTTPIYFEEEQTEEALEEKRNDTIWLLGTNLDKAWREKAVLWKLEFDQLCKILEQVGLSSRRPTWGIYKWAATILTSRCFPSDPGMSGGNDQHRVLLPVVDLFNHKFPTKVNWFFDRGSFQLKSEEPFVQCKEIFNNYGGKGNDELLNGYGFCIPDNPCDSVAIRFGQLPPPVVQELESIFMGWDQTKVHYIRGSNFYGGLYQVRLQDRPGITESGIPPALWTVLEVIKKHENKGQAPWRTTLAGRCALLELLASKYDDIDQHADLLPFTPVNDKQRYAKMYRDGQMKILKESVDQMEGIVLRQKFLLLDEALDALRKVNRQAEQAAQTWERVAVVMFGTASPDEIRRQDLETEAWMFWLCAAWVYITEQADRDTWIHDWIHDLLESHPFGNAQASCQPDPIFKQLEKEVGSIWQRPGLYEWATRTVSLEGRMLALLNEHEYAGKVLIGVAGH